MSSWKIKRTDTFVKDLKKHKNHHELLKELDQKLKEFKKDPLPVGGKLSGTLHGYHSTRLTRKYRMVFKIDEKNKSVYLIAIDHRGKVYQK